MNQPTPIIRALSALSVIAATAAALQARAPSQVNIKVQNGSAQARRDSLAQADKARLDSMAITARARQDSMGMAERGRRDSIAMADRARQDSVLLGDANRQLAEERTKRSEMENQLLTTGLLVMDAVYFEPGRTEISLNSKPYLDMLSKMLVKYPKLQIEVAGHTDNIGRDDFNQTLSDGRAAAVKAYLISQAPELKERLSSKGYGEAAPKADNRTAEGRKYNRRTELQVLNKDALQEYAPSRVGGTGTAPSGTEAGTGTTGKDSAAPVDSLFRR
jgi:outer membrane protein OmpA-like peptidoglycan-associated protein